jgi:putative ABC transport system permease protein
MEHLFRRNEFAGDLQDELSLHLDLRARKLEADGVPDAHFAARRQFGNPGAIQDASSQAWGFNGYERFLQDVRQSGRALLKTPGFTAFAVLTLAVGLGINTAIFSVVNGVMLAPLPYREPVRLVSLWEEVSRQDPNELTRGGSQIGRRTPRRSTVSVANLVDYRRSLAFEGLAAYSLTPKNLTGNGTPERLNGETVTAEFFRLLGVQPAIGRDLLPEDDRGDANAVVILTHSFWQRRFGADPAILGRAISLDARSYEVIGVLPAGFQSPQQMAVPGQIDFYVPAAYSKALLEAHGDHEVNVLGRLKPRVEMYTAQAELNVISSQLATQFPNSNNGTRAVIAPLRDDVVSSAKEPLLALLGASGLIVLITCLNIANLLLIRAIGRRHETSVRFALGASRFRVIRQFLAESMLLAAGGCAGGLLFGWAILRVLLALAPAQMPRLANVAMDWRVFGAAAALSVFTGLVFGLAPAWHAAASKAADSLRTATRNSGGRPQVFWRTALTVSEMALSLVLLTGAGLLLKSFVTLIGVDLGFHPDRVVAMNINLPQLRYPESQQRLRFFQELSDRVQALPGVQSAAFANRMPLRGGWGGSVYVDYDPLRIFDLDRQAVNLGYFQTLGITLLRGRLFTPDDREGTSPVAVVDQTFARMAYGDADPIGRHIRIRQNGPWMTIIGVVADIRRGGKSAYLGRQLYIPALQTGLYPAVRLADFAVRTAGDPRDLINAIQQQVWALDKDQPVTGVRTMEEIIDASVAERRFETILLLIFAGMAVGLAMLGVFGVLSYAVRQRTSELGIRIALGAPPLAIIRMVMRQAATLVGIGAVAGLAGAWILSRFLQSLLFQVPPHDFATYAAAVVVLAAAAFAAAIIPARRGANVDPIVALRYE